MTGKQAREERVVLVLLINLDRSVDRLEAANTQLEKLELDYQRVSATDGHRLDAQELAAYRTVKSRRRIGRDLSHGEIACYLSHLDCLRRFTVTDHDTCLIVEDDIEIARNAAQVLREAGTWIARQHAGHVDLIHMSRRARKIHRPVTTGQSALDAAGFCYAPYLPMTTGAILWSRAGAKDFVDATTTIDAPVDEALQAWCAARGRSYGFAKPPMRPRGEDSLIETDRRGAKRTRTMAGSIVRLINRVPTYARAHVHRVRFATGQSRIGPRGR